MANRFIFLFQMDIYPASRDPFELRRKIGKKKGLPFLFPIEGISARRVIDISSALSLYRGIAPQMGLVVPFCAI